MIKKIKHLLFALMGEQKIVKFESTDAAPVYLPVSKQLTFHFDVISSGIIPGVTALGISYQTINPAGITIDPATAADSKVLSDYATSVESTVRFTGSHEGHLPFDILVTASLNNDKSIQIHI